VKKSWMLLPLLAAGCITLPPLAKIAIGEPEIRAIVATLASDAFEGRMAGTPGEARTTAYLAERFRAAGLVSGARGPTPYLDPFTIKAVKNKLPPAGAKMPGGQRGFMERMNAAGTFTNAAGATAQWTEMSDAQRLFLQTHAQRWIPGWSAQVLQHARTDYYRGLAYLTVGVLAKLEAALEPLTHVEVAE